MFNKKAFAELLKLAMGDRKLNEYARQSGVSSAHISRLQRAILDTPPSPKIIKKLSEHAQNDISYDLLMQAAGHIESMQSYDKELLGIAETSADYETIKLVKRIEKLDPQRQKFIEEAVTIAEGKKTMDEQAATMGK